MELKDLRITKAKLGVMLMAIVIIIAASELSPMFSTAGENKPANELTTTGTNSIRELSFDDEFTIKDPLIEAGGRPNKNFTGSYVPASFKPGSTPGLSETGDSLIYENDSVFTIEGVKDELSKEGDWIKVTAAEVDPDGVVDNSGGFDNEINTDYIWRPRNVAAGWSPYTNGYWSYTNCGWMWVSYYDWGWRPYHYGRWWYSSYYGWVWSPGFIFAPAWVVWMYNDGYCGWYPISPRIRCDRNWGYRCHGMRYRVRHWNFCDKKDFANPLHPPVLVVDPSYNGVIIKTTTYDGVLAVDQTGVKGKGPDVKTVEEAGGVKIKTEDITKYGTKNISTKNDETKKVDEVNTTKNEQNTGRQDETKQNTTKQSTGETPGKNDGVKENTGGNTNTTKQDQNTGKQDQNTGKQDQNNNTKQDGTKDNGTKRNDGSNGKKETYTPPPTKNDPPTKKDTYTPPKQNNPPPKQDNPPPKKDSSPKKETYTPPKNDNPPKQNNPPPKKDTYTPPKNDNGSKGNDDKGK